MRTFEDVVTEAEHLIEERDSCDRALEKITQMRREYDASAERITLAQSFVTSLRFRRCFPKISIRLPRGA